MITIKLDELRFAQAQRTPGCPGTEMFVATHFRSPMPACLVFYRHVNMYCFEILDIYTECHFRRQGVALRTLKALRDWYGQVSFTTATVNEQSRGLILKAGFQQERDGWFLRPQQEEPCPVI